MSHADYLMPWVETADLRERLDSIVKVIRLILDESSMTTLRAGSTRR